MFSKRNILVGGLAFAAGLVATLFVLREPTQPLTAELLADARQRWNQVRPANYRIRYVMNGAEHEVECRGRAVLSLTVDGRETRTAEPAAYSVDGLFDIFDLDLENLADPHGPFAGRAEAMLLRVRFSPAFGYPERYLRSAGGAGRGASFELIEFVPLSAHGPTGD